MGRKTIALLSAAALCLAVVLPLASAGTRRPQAAASTGACLVDGNVVRATGLPVDVLLNFIVSDANGGWGQALGFSDGTWSVTVPDRSGPTTYQFTSVTWGKDGSKYYVYAQCSAA
jgi:hypothetical protein